MTISQIYTKVNNLWTKGLNPTVNARLTPKDQTKLCLNYLEKDTIDTNGDVNTDITITVSRPGPITEEDIGILSNLNLTSQGYSSEFYFQNLGHELKLLLNKFLKNLPEDYGIYNVVFEVYSDIETNNTLTNNRSSNKAKVYGETYAAPCGDSCNNGLTTCQTNNQVQLCSDITYVITTNPEGVCNTSMMDSNNTSTGTSGINCFWSNGSCGQSKYCCTNTGDNVN